MEEPLHRHLWLFLLYISCPCLMVSPELLPLLLPSHISGVRLCATPWTAAHQAPLSLGFSRQEHWSGLPLPSPHELLAPFNVQHLYIFIFSVMSTHFSASSTRARTVPSARNRVWLNECMVAVPAPRVTTGLNGSTGRHTQSEFFLTICSLLHPTWASSA